MNALQEAPTAYLADAGTSEADSGASEADLWMVRNLEAYLVRVRAEARDSRDAERRLRMLSGQIEAALDMATKMPAAATL